MAKRELAGTARAAGRLQPGGSQRAPHHHGLRSDLPPVLHPERADGHRSEVRRAVALRLAAGRARVRRALVPRRLAGGGRRRHRGNPRDLRRRRDVAADRREGPRSRDHPEQRGPRRRRGGDRSGRRRELSRGRRRSRHVHTQRPARAVLRDTADTGLRAEARAREGERSYREEASACRARARLPRLRHHRPRGRERRARACLVGVRRGPRRDPACLPGRIRRVFRRRARRQGKKARTSGRLRVWVCRGGHGRLRARAAALAAGGDALRGAARGHRERAGGARRPWAVRRKRRPGRIGAAVLRAVR